MDTIKTLTTPADAATPTTGGVTAIALSNLATTALKGLAGVLVGHGYLQASGTEAFIGVGMLVLTYVYSFWKDYGRSIAKASLDILRARVLDAAAKAQRNPGMAQTVLASLDSHVAATTPVSGPAGPVEQAVADKGVLVVPNPPGLQSLKQ